MGLPVIVFCVDPKQYGKRGRNNIRHTVLPKIFQCSILVDLIGTVLHVHIEKLGSLCMEENGERKGLR